MPSQQEVRWSQLKVGVIVLISTVVLVALLFLMTSSSGLGILSHKLTVTTYFENSAGLKTGAAVNLEGVTIGTVKTVTIVNSPERKLTPVKVVMKLNDKYAASLKKIQRLLCLRWGSWVTRWLISTASLRWVRNCRMATN